MTGRSVAAIALRPATAGDSLALARLHARLFDPPWRPEDFDRLLGATTSSGLVATMPGSDLAGFVLSQVVMDEAEILTVAVSLEWQRAGIGGRLLDALMADLTHRGVERVHLEVAAGNGPARALYARHGFMAVGARAGYYGATPAGTAITMVKRLDANT